MDSMTNARGGRARLRLAALLVLAPLLAACGGNGDEDNPAPSDADEPAPAEAAGEISVAVIAPFSGPAGFIGEPQLNAVQMAVDDYGPLSDGSTIDLVTEDDGCRPEEAVGIVQRLVEREEVVAAIGPACSGAMAAAQEVMAAEGFVHLSNAYLPALSEGGDGYYFRGTPHEGQLQVAFLDYILEQTEYRQFALIHGDSAYSVGVGTQFNELVAENPDVDIVHEAMYSESDTDFTGQIGRISGTGAEAIFLAGYDADTGLFTRQLRQQGIDLPIYSGAQVATQGFLDVAGSAAEGTVFSTNFVVTDPDVSDFVARYEDRYGSAPNHAVPSAYLITVGLLTALDSVGGDASSEDLRDALRDTTLQTEFGDIRFDENGDLVEPRVLIAVIEDGQPQILESLIAAD